MAFTEGFISELVGRRATVDDLPIGKISDFIVSKPEETFPEIDGIVVKTKQGRRLAPMSLVDHIDPNGNVALTMIPHQPAPVDEEALYLVSDLLDKQIVDVDGRKLVRINDLEVTSAGGRLRVIAADVGVSGLLRRLGLRALGDKLTPPRLSKRAVPRALIPWNSVAPITEKNPTQVRLAVAKSKLSRLHPSELADVIADLSKREAAALVKQLDDETAADAFEHLDRDTQKSLIEDIGTERAADIVEEMDSDDAADLLGDLPEEERRELLDEMSTHTAHELRELAKYPDDTAGGLMTTDFVWIYPYRTTEATIQKIRELGPNTEFIYYLYVVDRNDRLQGVLSLRTLLLALPTAFIDRIMERNLVTVSPETPAVEVAATIAKYDLLAVPVVHETGKLLGIVTVDDAIDAIMDPDVARRLPRFTTQHKPHAAETA